VYAIIEDSGTQIKVTAGEVVDVDLRELSGTKSVTFDRVLMVGGEGTETRLGKPYLAGASVTAEIVGEVLGDKIVIHKYARRKYKRRQGHRQAYLRVRIGEIKG